MTVTINGTSGITYPDVSTQNTSPKVGMVNRIINGGMTIDQRNAGAAVTPAASQYFIDRFFAQLNVTSKFSTQQLTATPPIGFSQYLRVTSLSAYSVAAGDVATIVQPIEGFNVSDLGWGTANAATVTVSFRVRSSLTGNFGGTIQNNGQARSYPFPYTISAANTWEEKTVTIPGDTSGTWLTNNGIGIQLKFSMGSGSTFSGTAGAWSSSLFLQPAVSTSIISTNGATWDVTGVQLEKGSTATPFEFRSIGSELALCQRYLPCFKASAISQTVGSAYASTSTAGFATYTFKVTSRVPPTGVTVSSAGHFEVLSGGSGIIAITALTFSYASDDACTLATTVASGQNANAGGILRSSNASAQVQFTGCEL